VNILLETACRLTTDVKYDIPTGKYEFTTCSRVASHAPCVYDGGETTNSSKIATSECVIDRFALCFHYGLRSEETIHRRKIRPYRTSTAVWVHYDTGQLATETPRRSVCEDYERCAISVTWRHLPARKIRLCCRPQLRQSPPTTLCLSCTAASLKISLSAKSQQSQQHRLNSSYVQFIESNAVQTHMCVCVHCMCRPMWNTYRWTNNNNNNKL